MAFPLGELETRMPDEHTPLTSEEITKKLKDAFEVDGDIGGGITPVLNYEREYRSDVVHRWGGYLRYADSFQHLYKETLESADAAIRSGQIPRIASHYPDLLLSHVVLFKRFRATEILFTYGYSLSGHALMRDVYERAIFLGAIANRLTDLERLEGGPGVDLSNPDQARKEMRRNRMAEERRLIGLMCGAESGLTAEDQYELSRLKNTFDDEVHGGHLSTLDGQDWRKGLGPLPLLSDPDSKVARIYFNRALEAAWLLTRTMCFLQPEPGGFGKEWAWRWGVMDELLRDFMYSVDAMGKKPFALSVVRWVDARFAFTPGETAYYQAPKDGPELGRTVGLD